MWSSEGLESGNGYGDDEGFEISEGSSGLVFGYNVILVFWRFKVFSEDYVVLGYVVMISYELLFYDYVCVIYKSLVILGIFG